MVSKGLRWFKIVLCSMLLGGLWRLSERYAWMAMREITVNASNPIVEERYWDVFPSRCLRFWPWFMRESRDVAAFLEKTNPVLVKTRMTGLGAFAVDMKLLSPHMLIEWKGAVWCISEEGRMWNLAEGSFGFKELEIPTKPVWRIAASQFAGENERLVPSGVFPSFFSTEAIDDFLKWFGDEPWFDGVEEVVLDRRAGGDLFELRYAREGQDFTILIQRDKYELKELSLALEHILGRLGEEGGDHLVDATYEGKIIVKDLPAGAAEGSSR